MVLLLNLAGKNVVLEDRVGEWEVRALNGYDFYITTNRLSDYFDSYQKKVISFSRIFRLSLVGLLILRSKTTFNSQSS
jgi:hypothetical protein